MTRRIAMWSGPRNISTAMMRSWENRSDCSVVDEPFYAYYLNETQSPHPLFDEILASQSNDFDTVAKQMSQGICTSEIQYQKHMTHHMLQGCDLGWTKNLQHCFLIRDPAYVVNSYTNSRGECSVSDIGIIRQYELYREITKICKQTPPVIDSLSVLSHPKKNLTALCESLDIPFDTSMLSWPTGPRDSDGVWAIHWYHSVEASTGFGQAKIPELNLNKQQLQVVEEVMPYYLKLKSNVLV